MNKLTRKNFNQIDRGLAAIDQLDKDIQGRSPAQLKKIKRNAAKFSKGKGYNGRQLNFYIDNTK